MWKLGFPRTSLLLAGRALLLQTMHPVVGAGVRDFSTFRVDPWGRLDRTLVSLQSQLFGGDGAVDEAARLRALHKTIRGVGFDGQPYSALNPEAYAWVHLSNFDTLLTFDRWIARRLSVPQQEDLYQEWRQAGRVLGIREQHMPSDVAALRRYVGDMVANSLVENPTAHEVLGSLRLAEVGSPPWAFFPEPLWRALRPAGRMLLYDMTVGTLPSTLRHKLGLSWTPLDRRRLQALAIVIRTATAPIPDRLLQYPQAYRAQQAARRAAQRVAS
jgi:uncharacterized protein (DUF2236 family)